MNETPKNLIASPEIAGSINNPRMASNDSVSTPAPVALNVPERKTPVHAPVQRPQQGPQQRQQQMSDNALRVTGLGYAVRHADREDKTRQPNHDGWTPY